MSDCPIRTYGRIWHIFWCMVRRDIATFFRQAWYQAGVDSGAIHEHGPLYYDYNRDALRCVWCEETAFTGKELFRQGIDPAPTEGCATIGGKEYRIIRRAWQ